jgi:carbon starvation protein
VLFGTSNQLLAALSLLGVSVWLRRLGKPNLFTLVPMSFVMLVTLWSLVLQAGAAARQVATSGLRYDAVVLNGGVSVLLLVLAFILVVEAGRSWSRAVPAVKMAG